MRQKIACSTILLAAWLIGTAMTKSPIQPRHYDAAFARSAIQIDGLAQESAWEQVAWSDCFVDICETDARHKPLYDTRFKMLWDSSFLYVYAHLDEPHIWAYCRERDAVIFHENDFELFVDPDGDGELYGELEINALNTVWDLLLTKPYKESGRPIDSWDIQGLNTAVHIEGTINDPSDVDAWWGVEMAIPWSVLEELNTHTGAPHVGETWRINFSRVNWQTEIKEGRYVRKSDRSGSKLLPEYNWVWSRQDTIAMHAPDTWGYLHFVK